uniref:Uncharacterized protein n=1 Tax=viral metagenome TaxID=1070528 RepID=A0A6H2A0I2_9ZZZZ
MAPAAKCPLLDDTTEEEGREICLHCPRPECAYDVGAHRRQDLKARNEEIYKLAAAGFTTKTICKRFNLKRQALYAILHPNP